jgi:hypothetical protein
MNTITSKSLTGVPEWMSIISWVLFLNLGMLRRADEFIQFAWMVAIIAVTIGVVVRFVRIVRGDRGQA